jgi:hypothetical protein
MPRGFPRFWENPQTYAELRRFCAKVIQTLKKIRLIYPALSVETTQTEITVRTTVPAIAARKR